MRVQRASSQFTTYVRWVDKKSKRAIDILIIEMINHFKKIYDFEHSKKENSTLRSGIVIKGNTSSTGTEDVLHSSQEIINIENMFSVH